MGDFEAQDEDFEEKVRKSFARQKVMVTLGANLESVTAGRVEIVLPYSETLAQQDGFLHAGISAAVMDSACGYAAYSLMPPGAEVLSVEFKVNLLRPAAGREFRAIGEVVKPGRTLTYTRADLFAVDDGDPRVVAAMTGTMMTIIKGA